MSIQTKYIQIATPAAVQDQELLEAAQIIRDGGLVAFPTETVYGLGANALDEKAAKKIYEAKGRPSDNPLIAHISCYEELEPLVTGIPQAGGKLARRYWPGPLTMVFPKSPAVPYGTTGGLDTVAVRMPSDPVASRPSPTTARHVWQDMNGRINMILDGGPVGIGLESTIVDVSGPVPVLLRPGAITLEMLRDTVGEVEVDPAIQGPPAEGLRPKAPGMKYRHYAPRGELTLVEGESRAVVSAIRRLVEEGLAEGRKVAVICTEETRDQYSGGILRCVGTRTRQETIAHNLFAVLRELDDLGAEIIYSESFSQDHLGRAVMNRLMKAAGYRVMQV